MFSLIKETWQGTKAYLQLCVSIVDATCDPPSAAIRTFPEIVAWELEKSSTQSQARASSLNYSDSAGANEDIFGIYPRSRSRQGVFAAAHWRWYKAFEHAHDLAFVKLNKSFKKARMIPWTLAPAGVDKLSIKVVGYPGDMEDGKLYIAEGTAGYNLTVEKKNRWDNVLIHIVDTYRGNSGCPVIVSKGNVIAVHCTGVKDFSNQAAVIDDQFNDFHTINHDLN
ncbi:hypothetical protein FHL15_010093 [Xylaria flabelliformis]|uniref:Serine protease n=1 Tax=Xylaria flabelliformis TaxID=2512241 RepID=A0A553HLY9_9PEZI|nr:hypothetical protein FHL15_010093 [Xylaria flabelliformis]